MDWLPTKMTWWKRSNCKPRLILFYVLAMINHHSFAQGAVGGRAKRANRNVRHKVSKNFTFTFSCDKNTNRNDPLGKARMPLLPLHWSWHAESPKSHESQPHQTAGCNTSTFTFLPEIANRRHGIQRGAVLELWCLDQRLFYIWLRERSSSGQLWCWAGMATLWQSSFLTKVLAKILSLTKEFFFKAFSGETEKIVPSNSLSPFSEAPANLKSSDLRKAYRLAQAKIDGWSCHLWTCFFLVWTTVNCSVWTTVNCSIIWRNVYMYLCWQCQLDIP